MILAWRREFVVGNFLESFLQPQLAGGNSLGNFLQHLPEEIVPCHQLGIEEKKTCPERVKLAARIYYLKGRNFGTVRYGFRLP